MPVVGFFKDFNLRTSQYFTVALYICWLTNYGTEWVLDAQLKLVAAIERFFLRRFFRQRNNVVITINIINTWYRVSLSKNQFLYVPNPFCRFAHRASCLYVCAQPLHLLPPRWNNTKSTAVCKKRDLYYTFKREIRDSAISWSWYYRIEPNLMNSLYMVLTLFITVPLHLVSPLYYFSLLKALDIRTEWTLRVSCNSNTELSWFARFPSKM